MRTYDEEVSLGLDTLCGNVHLEGVGVGVLRVAKVEDLCEVREQSVAEWKMEIDEPSSSS